MTYYQFCISFQIGRIKTKPFPVHQIVLDMSLVYEIYSLPNLSHEFCIQSRP